MYEAYKDSYKQNESSQSFYNEIGGPLGEWAAENPEYFQNTCACRLSKAMNYNGFKIKKGTPNTYLGGDGNYYFVNAKAMQAYLSKRCGEPRLLKKGNILKNTVYFQSGFSGGVSGHLDIMYRGKAAHKFYNKPTYYWH